MVVGTVWAISGNVGEWYLLTEKEIYLNRLLEGDIIRQQFPEKQLPGADMTNAPPGLGGEDSGWSLAQASDGTVHVQADNISA